MKINLKKLAQQKEQLKFAMYRTEQHGFKTETNKLKHLLTFIEEVERDLEMGGESIVELDKPRLEAIEERNRMLNFMHNADDV
jgi:hypothetical protein